MSAAANNWLKDRPLLVAGFSFLGSLIIALTVQARNNSYADDKELKKELSKKVDAEYVDNKMKAHERTQEAELNAIRKEISDYKTTQSQILDLTTEIRDMTRTRLNRLEDKVYKD